MTVSGPTIAFCDRNKENNDRFVTVTKRRKTTQQRSSVTRDLVVIHTGTVLRLVLNEWTPIKISEFYLVSSGRNLKGLVISTTVSEATYKQN